MLCSSENEAGERERVANNHYSKTMVAEKTVCHITRKIAMDLEQVSKNCKNSKHGIYSHNKRKQVRTDLRSK